MIRTPRPGRRGVAVSAALATAATLAGAGSVPLASAGEYNGAVCQPADTRVFIRNVDGVLSVSASYWNGSMTDPVRDENPKSVKWNVRKSGDAVTVRAVGRLQPLGGFQHVEGSETGSDTNVAWTGVIELRKPPAGTSYELCGDDLGRANVPAPW